MKFEMHGQLTLNRAMSETMATFRVDAGEQSLGLPGLAARPAYLPVALCVGRVRRQQPTIRASRAGRPADSPSRFNGIILTLVNVQPQAEASVSQRDVVRNRQI